MKDKISNWLNENQQEFIEISDKIWEYAETSLQEHRSAKLIVNFLKEKGFKVDEGVAEMPTAFVATFGEGKPIIAILGEYDALPGLSQDKAAEKNAIVEGAAGHGCGHNLLGGAGIAAAVALKERISQGELKGTIKFYGTPAEEDFNAKGFMVHHGLFEGVDIALCWHPYFVNSVINASSLAIISALFKFKGRTAHAAADPHNGRSGLDAVELMNVGTNYLREHMLTTSRIHYVITKGGDVPNIVPEEGEVWYYVRAPKYKEVETLYQRVLKVAKGAAMMTETELEIDYLGGTWNTRYNKVILDVLHKNMVLAGPSDWTEEEKTFALKLQESYPEGAIDAQKAFIEDEWTEVADQLFSVPLNDFIPPQIKKGKPSPGSTDVGDVSWVVPLAEFTAATGAIGSPWHAWQTTATCGMSIGHKGMMLAAKVLAFTVADFMTNEELVTQAKAEFEEVNAKDSYTSPFSTGDKPPFHRIVKDKLQYPDLE
ncbi:MAG: amidohydrolase [Candidatus Heimdallarchaeota archaeon]|nr:amidohydrolase [Candidatus Heimdallarchaeota archaeon]MCK5047818.1 amidohydrolase [Candidatus Heimdallarchaeota archaeon]